jgi:hypothetical protein
MTTSLLAQRKRAGLAAWHASLVLSAITVGVIVITAAFISQGTGPVSANANDHPSPLGPPVSGSSAATYPLVFAPNSPKVCAEAQFCINATLGFSGQTATIIPPATTVTGSNGTTIVHGSTTTIIRGNATTEKLPDLYSSYSVYVTALVQDAVTGQNVTTSSGSSVITDLCYIQPTGFTHCYIVGHVPAARTFKVTVFVTTPDGKTILAPPSPPVTVSR